MVRSAPRRSTPAASFGLSFDRRLRRLAGAALVCGAAFVGCGLPVERPLQVVPAPTSAGSIDAYLHDPRFRRRELEGALVSHTNGYAKRRLASYSEGQWGRLKEWNPPVSPARFGARGSEMVYVALAVPRTSDEGELLELGRRAFVGYPLQLADYAVPALARGDASDRYGLYDQDGQPGGLVSAKLEDGSVHLALTCATCHAKPERGALVLGKTNDALRMDLLDADFAHTEPVDWGRGRVDVTDDGVDNPTAITDLRPTRFQTNLHRAGTLRNGLIPLAIRIETLAITSLGERARPPREIAMGLALYVRSLGAALRVPERESEGARIFERTCARCHAGAGLTGAAVPFDEVNTDASILLGPERTTGRARVPSLRGVADRTPLLSNGSVSTLRQLLAPRAERPTGGHVFGQDLLEPEREKLLLWLSTLD